MQHRVCKCAGNNLQYDAITTAKSFYCINLYHFLLLSYLNSLLMHIVTKGDQYVSTVTAQSVRDRQRKREREREMVNR